MFGVFLPFAAGYYLSYLFRTINSLISESLSADLGLDASSLGLLTSVYFLIFGAAQIPIGILLDRFGPRRGRARCCSPRRWGPLCSVLRPVSCHSCSLAQ
nr:MFS transporter [Bradyrhizobium sp. CCGB12]